MHANPEKRRPLPAFALLAALALFEACGCVASRPLPGKAYAQPLPPAALVAEIPETNWVTLEWNPSMSPGVIGYQVASNSVPSNYTIFAKTVGTNISLVEPSIGTSNWFVVRCSNSIAFSTWSDPLLYYVTPPRPATNAYSLFLFTSTNGTTWTTQTTLAAWTNPPSVSGGAMRFWKLGSTRTNL